MIALLTRPGHQYPQFPATLLCLQCFVDAGGKCVSTEYRSTRYRRGADAVARLSASSLSALSGLPLRHSCSCSTPCPHPSHSPVPAPVLSLKVPQHLPLAVFLLSSSFPASSYFSCSCPSISSHFRLHSSESLFSSSSFSSSFSYVYCFLSHCSSSSVLLLLFLVLLSLPPFVYVSFLN